MSYHASMPRRPSFGALFLLALHITLVILAGKALVTAIDHPPFGEWIALCGVFAIFAALALDRMSLDYRVGVSLDCGLYRFATGVSLLVGAAVAAGLVVAGLVLAFALSPVTLKLGILIIAIGAFTMLLAGMVMIVTLLLMFILTAWKAGVLLLFHSTNEINRHPLFRAYLSGEVGAFEVPRTARQIAAARRRELAARPTVPPPPAPAPPPAKPPLQPAFDYPAQIEQIAWPGKEKDRLLALKLGQRVIAAALNSEGGISAALHLAPTLAPHESAALRRRVVALQMDPTLPPWDSRDGWYPPGIAEIAWRLLQHWPRDRIAIASDGSLWACLSDGTLGRRGSDGLWQHLPGRNNRLLALANFVWVAVDEEVHAYGCDGRRLRTYFPGYGGTRPQALMAFADRAWVIQPLQYPQCILVELADPRYPTAGTGTRRLREIGFRDNAIWIDGDAVDSGELDAFASHQDVAVRINGRNLVRLGQRGLQTLTLDAVADHVALSPQGQIWIAVEDRLLLITDGMEQNEMARFDGGIAALAADISGRACCLLGDRRLVRVNNDGERLDDGECWTNG